MKLTKRGLLMSAAAVATVFGINTAIPAGIAQAADELNFMTWCDHDDPNIIRPVRGSP